MLKIRLARGGKSKTPFFRIVLTEHTKPCQSGYKEVLGWFDPINHKMEANTDLVIEWIKKGALPTERIAKLLYAYSKNDLFKKYYVERERIQTKESEE